MASDADEVEHSWTEMLVWRGMHVVDDAPHRRGAGRMVVKRRALMKKFDALNALNDTPGIEEP